ncbi:MAG: hypothetical protein AAGA92_06045 [Planctomycetota bacterium]
MPSDHIARTIDDIQQQISELESELTYKKRIVNDLCGLASRPAIYSDADLVSKSSQVSTRPDEYYGKPLATVVGTVLEKRQAANLGAATVNEIYEEMKSGGFHFVAKNDENAKRGLYQSLGKNTTRFHKLPNGTYGLREWYPDAPRGRRENGSRAEAEKPLHEELQGEQEPEAVSEEPVGSKPK